MLLKMAAIGDSVVWGQGLATNDKFSRITAREVPEIDAFNVVDLSHSGAKIGPPDKSDSFHFKRGWADFPDVIKGEIPSSTPSVIAQINDLVATGQDFDVILMDGFANDVGFFAPASPDADAFEAFVNQLIIRARERIRVSLAHLRQHFPDALVIYSGYYPGLSEDSDFPLEADLIQATLLVAVTVLGNAVIPGLGLVAGVVGAILAEKSKQQIKRQYQHFADEIQAAITEEIAEFNRNSRCPEVIYSQSGFSTQNSMYAPEPFIHALSEPFDVNIGQQRADFAFDHVPPTSSVFETREEARAQVGKALPMELEDVSSEFVQTYTTINAHLAHPNASGARRYADIMVPRTSEQTVFSVRDRINAIGMKDDSLRDGLMDRFGTELRNRSIRLLGSLSRIDCIEAEFRARTIEGFTNAEPFKMEIAWNNFWAPMRQLNRDATARRWFIDFPEPLAAQKCHTVAN